LPDPRNLDREAFDVKAEWFWDTSTCRVSRHNRLH
jgi:hypothetical protein